MPHFSQPDPPAHRPLYLNLVATALPPHKGQVNWTVPLVIPALAKASLWALANKINFDISSSPSDSWLPIFYRSFPVNVFGCRVVSRTPPQKLLPSLLRVAFISPRKRQGRKPLPASFCHQETFWQSNGISNFSAQYFTGHLSGSYAHPVSQVFVAACARATTEL